MMALHPAWTAAHPTISLDVRHELRAPHVQKVSAVTRALKNVLGDFLDDFELAEATVFEGHRHLLCPRQM